MQNAVSPRPRYALAALAVASFTGWVFAGNEWPQFGGPNRNFMVDAKGLADSWPETGPQELWKRELGDGYSTIVSDGDVLYTMYRIGEDEFTVALDRKTGKTLWEHKNHAPNPPRKTDLAPGPHTTPLLVGDHLYTIGTKAVMHCYNKKTGEVVWKHDLSKEFGAPVPNHGYGNSPIAYKNTVIVGVDRERPGEGNAPGEAKKEEKKDDGKKPEAQSLIAFDLSSGSVVWKSQDFPICYASPILIQFDGEPQLVLLMRKEIMGVNPDNGQLLWHMDVSFAGGYISTPLWNGQDILFCSSADGTRALKLTKKDGKTVPEQLWHSRKLRIAHANPILVGEIVCGSSGDAGPAFFTGVKLETGEEVWSERGFKKATCLYADDKVILLDEDGQLALLSVKPEGVKVHSQAKIAEHNAWAAPTLLDTQLYVRDRKHIMALELGTSSS